MKRLLPHIAQAQKRQQAFKQETINLEKQIAGLVERVMDASNQTVIAAYENKIDLLEKKRLVALENPNNGHQTMTPKAICLNSRLHSSQIIVKYDKLVVLAYRD